MKREEEGEREREKEREDLIQPSQQPWDRHSISLFPFLHKGLTLRLSNSQGCTAGDGGAVSQTQVSGMRQPLTTRPPAPSCPSSVGWTLGEVRQRRLKPSNRNSSAQWGRPGTVSGEVKSGIQRGHPLEKRSAGAEHPQVHMAKPKVKEIEGEGARSAGAPTT